MKNKQRFEEYIAQHLDSAHRLAEIYVKNPEDAKDVVAESIERALRSLHANKEPDFLIDRWFNRIVINTAINHLRKQSNRNAAIKDRTLYHFDDFSHLHVEELLELLAENDRRIVSMRFIDNLSLHEIADELGMNENTVKTRLYRSLRKLRLEIDNEGYRVNTKKDRTPVKTVGIVFVAALLSAMLVFNLSPTLAAAAYDIPIIGDIVRVITFNRFEYADRGYNADINVPEIQGLLDPELQEKLNAEFREYPDDLIRSFEASVIDLVADEAGEFDGESAHMSIKADYTVKTDNDHVLSLDAYLYSDVGGFVIHKFCTIDKRTGTQVTLAGLFKPDADYITPLSDYLVSEMIRLNAEEDSVYFVEGSEFEGDQFTALRPDQNFYISDEGKLVICFDKYEVSAGFMGSPEFVIPTEIMSDVLNSDLIK